MRMQHMWNVFLSVRFLNEPCALGLLRITGRFYLWPPAQIRSRLRCVRTVNLGPLEFAMGMQNVIVGGVQMPVAGRTVLLSIAPKSCGLLSVLRKVVLKSI